MNRDPVRAGRDRSREARLDPRQRQAALARREGEGRCAGGRQRHSAAIDRQPQAGRDLGELVLEERTALGAEDRSVTVAVVALDLLEGRDLGLIEDVVNLHRSLRDAHLAQVIDREVAQRMSRGAVGKRQQCEQRGEQQGRGGDGSQRSAPAHPNPSRALCARWP